MTDSTECPYCGHDQTINHDDGYGCDESTTYEQFCGGCERIFAYTTSIHFYYKAAKAPCMNGEEHAFKPTVTAPKWWTKMRCEYCDETRNMTESEKDQYDIPPIPAHYLCN